MGFYMDLNPLLILYSTLVKLCAHTPSFILPYSNIKLTHYSDHTKDRDVDDQPGSSVG